MKKDETEFGLTMKIKLKSYFNTQIQKASMKLIEASVLNNIKPNIVFQEVIDGCNGVIKTYQDAMEKLGIDETHVIKRESGGFVGKGQSTLTTSRTKHQYLIDKLG